MFQFISIIAVLALVVGGVYSAYTYFIEEKKSDATPAAEPTTDATIISNPAPAKTNVTPQITDAVTQAPKKNKKKRYYHSKPKAKKPSAPARLKRK